MNKMVLKKCGYEFECTDSEAKWKTLCKKCFAQSKSQDEKEIVKEKVSGMDKDRFFMACAEMATKIALTKEEQSINILVESMIIPLTKKLYKELLKAKVDLIQDQNW